MSYIVLARRWRPKVFEEVVGQQHVTKVLKNAIKLGRIAHAYLFSGPRGVGKTSVARILAKSLNCEKGLSPEPCSQCKNCVEIETGRSPDVIEIDGASNRGIDNIRLLQESISYKPIRGAFKVYIIDEVHMLTLEAFNALLKTLEEPPPHVIFIFATTEPHKIPSTVLSRCQRFDFRRINPKEITDQLGLIAKKEGFDISRDILEAISLEADGSLRDAETLLEQVLAFLSEGVEAEDELLNLLGIVDRKTLFDVLKAILEKDLYEGLKKVQSVYDRGLEGVKFLQRLLEVLHNLLILKLSGGKREENLTEEEFNFLKNYADKVSIETIEFYYQVLLRSIELARRSSQPYFVLEMAVVKMANAPHVFSIPELSEKLDKLIRLHKEGSSEVKDQEVFAKGDFNFICSNWQKFLDWLASNEPSLYHQISTSKVEKNERGLTIYILPIYENLLKETKDRLRPFIERFFRIKLDELRIETDRTLSAKNGGGSARLDFSNSKHELLNHPVVKDLIEMFDGKVVDVRPFVKNHNLTYEE